jgi:hypothetical protein
MVNGVEFSERLLADKHFVKWLIEHNKLMIFRLTHIKASSKHHRGCHNVMLESDIQDILSEGKIKEHTIRRAFKGINLPEEINKENHDNADKMVLLAMYLTYEEPGETVLLTTLDKKSEYETSKHYEGVNSVTISQNEKGTNAINHLFQQFQFR